MAQDEEAPAINVVGSQGVQAGIGNVQYNIWQSKPGALCKTPPLQVADLRPRRQAAGFCIVLLNSILPSSAHSTRTPPKGCVFLKGMT